MSEQKTMKSIVMNLHPVQSVTAPVRTRTSLQSGAPAEHLTLAQMLAERRKGEDEKLRKEEEQQKRLSRKRGKEGKEVYSEGETTSNADAYLFFVIGTRSEYEVITILPTVRSIAAFFIS